MGISDVISKSEAAYGQFIVLSGSPATGVGKATRNIMNAAQVLRALLTHASNFIGAKGQKERVQVNLLLHVKSTKYMKYFI